MPKSLLEQLPEIVANGRKEAERILESLENRHRVQLQTREIVLPAKDSAEHDWVTAQARQARRDALAPAQGALLDPVQPGLSVSPETPWTNRLIYGDNLLAMAALLAGDDTTPSLRGKVDLIYIDPPFDSKADYRTKVVLPGIELEQKPTVIEQFAYSDTWSDGTASYLAMMTPRLILMRELLADTGSIYVHLDWHVGHYVKVVMDEVFGKTNFGNEIVWKRQSAHNDSSAYGSVHDNVFFYHKTSSYIWNRLLTAPSPDYVENFFDQVEHESGRRYARGDLTAGGLSGGGYDYEFRGIRRIWRCPITTMERHEKEGRLHWPKKGVPRLKRFLDEFDGVPLQDVWTDIRIIHNQSSERVDYNTQKPESLLERILKTSTNSDSLAACRT